MQIQPIFKAKMINQRTINQGAGCIKKYQDIKLDNNKQLTICTYYVGNSILNKMYYLTDEVGKWVKSKLKLYSDNKVYKILKSEQK